MAAQKKRTDIFNVAMIATKVSFDNKIQKLQALFKGYPLFMSNDEIKETIKVIEAETKEEIKKLKSLLK